MSLARKARSAFCLACKNSLTTDIFTDSEALINRNAGLFRAFCEYLELSEEVDYEDDDCISKEFPFCHTCKRAVVELKALDNEIKALLGQTRIITLKLVGKILESSSDGNNYGKDGKFSGEKERNMRVLDLEGFEDVKFSQSTYRNVTKLRRSICDRYNVSVAVSRCNPGSVIKIISSPALKSTRIKIEADCDNQTSNSDLMDEGQDNFETTEDVGDPGEEERKCRSNREFTPEFDGESQDVMDFSCEDFTETQSNLSGYEDEETALNTARDRVSGDDNGDCSESDLVGKGDDVLVDENDSSTDSSDDDRTYVPSRIRSQNDGARRSTSLSNKSSNLRQGRKYVEVSAGEFLYDNKYKFELKEDKYYWCFCGYRQGKLGTMLRHLYKHTRRAALDKPLSNRLVQVTPDKIIYGNKFTINIVKGRFVCELCGFHRQRKYKTVQHIREVHIRNQPPPKYITHNLQMPNVNEETPKVEASSIKPVSQKKESSAELISYKAVRARLSRYKEVSPGKWLYDDKFPFQKDEDEDIFRCGSCSSTFPDLRNIVCHVRKYHFLRQGADPPTRPPGNRYRQIEPNRFLYAEKYFIDLINDRYVCAECGFHRASIQDTYGHIRNVHIRNLPGTKYLTKLLLPSTDSEQQQIEENNGKNDLCDDHDSMDENEESCGDETPTGMLPVRTRAKEISPGQWLYDDQFAFAKIDDAFHCSCSVIFPDFRAVVSHIRSAHYSRVVRSKFKLVHLEGDKYMYADKLPVEFIQDRWTCMTCNHNTKGKHKLFEHMRTTHINKTESLICDICGKVSSRKEAFRAHLLTHDPSNRNHICHICGKAFVLPLYLNTHIRKIHESKTLPCKHCDELFSSEKQLRSHEGSKHSGLKTFECPDCDQVFVTHKGLRRHTAISHPSAPKMGKNESQADNMDFSVLEVEVNDGTDFQLQI